MALQAAASSPKLRLTPLHTSRVTPASSGSTHGLLTLAVLPLRHAQLILLDMGAGHLTAPAPTGVTSSTSLGPERPPATPSSQIKFLYMGCMGAGHLTAPATTAVTSGSGAWSRAAVSSPSAGSALPMPAGLHRHPHLRTRSDYSGGAASASLTAQACFTFLQVI